MTFCLVLAPIIVVPGIYWQYWPIRFVFPRLACYMVWRFIVRPTGTNYYSMMVMPLIIGVWNIVAFVYALGLAYGIAALLDGRGGTRPAIVFFLSVFGCGLASYYQGRSHPLVLECVQSRAVILVGIFASRLLIKRRLEDSFVLKAASALVLYILCLTCVNSFERGWEYSGRFRDWLASTPHAMPVEWPLHYFKDSPPSERGLVVSAIKGLYMQKLRKPAPVDIMSEALLKADEDRVVECIQKRLPRAFVLLDRLLFPRAPFLTGW